MIVSRMTSPSPEVALPPVVKPPKKFRVALSFAGEKRPYVDQVAGFLAKEFGEDRILYDRYHEPEFARYDLGIYLPELYHNESELIVVIICKDYDKKEWCGLEWIAIHDLLKQRRDEEVMLANFDRATARGIYSSAGFLELDNKTPAQAAAAILKRLASNERDDHSFPPITEPPPPPTPPVFPPNNLPPRRSFFGREDELREIHGQLDPQSDTKVIAIEGLGGIGKTSLAVEAAYSHEIGLFGRIIYLPLKKCELDDDGLRILERPYAIPSRLALLSELARQLGEPEIERFGRDKRIDRISEVLGKERVLLILDNLESLGDGDRDKIISVLNDLPAGCKAIFTSRDPISVEDPYKISLGPLAQEASLQMLARIARSSPLLEEATPAERIDLYQQTAGNPLLMRWTAGQLGRGSCRSLKQALARLRACPEDNDPLEFIFSHLAEDFKKDEVKAMAVLTYFAQPLQVQHVAAIAHLTVDDAREALNTMANQSLVQTDAQGERYSLAPLAADFLRGHEEERVAHAGESLENYAYTTIAENGLEKHRRYPVLETAWESLEPAFRIFLAGPNERLQKVCEGLFRFLEFSGRWDKMLELSQAAETRALLEDDQDHAGWRAYDVGMVHYLRGHAEDVLACAKRAEGHWKKGGAGIGERERATALRLRGLGLRLQGKYREALTAFHEARKLFHKSNPGSQDMGVVISDVAGVERLLGNHEFALNNYREALRLARKVGHKEGVATYIGHLAEMELIRENWTKAGGFARKALKLSQELGRQELIAENSSRLAMSLARRGRAAKGLPFAEEAVRIFQRLLSPDLADALLALRECGGGEEESCVACSADHG